MCAGAKCTTAEFADVKGVCCSPRQTCAEGKAEGTFQCGGKSVDADGSQLCAGAKCTLAEFADENAACCHARQTCAKGRAESKFQCGRGSVDADGSPLCAGISCTAAEFANASSVCCSSRQTCAEGKADGKKCGGKSVDADGTLRCAAAKCSASEFADVNSVCCMAETVFVVHHEIILKGVSASVFNGDIAIIKSFREAVAITLSVPESDIINIKARDEQGRRQRILFTNRRLEMSGCR